MGWEGVVRRFSTRLWVKMCGQIINKLNASLTLACECLCKRVCVYPHMRVSASSCASRLTRCWRGWGVVLWMLAYFWGKHYRSPVVCLHVHV